MREKELTKYKFTSCMFALHQFELLQNLGQPFSLSTDHNWSKNGTDGVGIGWYSVVKYLYVTSGWLKIKRPTLVFFPYILTSLLNDLLLMKPGVVTYIFTSKTMNMCDFLQMFLWCLKWCICKHSHNIQCFVSGAKPKLEIPMLLHYIPTSKHKCISDKVTICIATLDIW